MTPYRIALANLHYPMTRDESVALSCEAIRSAAARGAAIVCFPECYVPGYRAPDKGVPPPDSSLLDEAWRTIAAEAGRASIAVVLGTERVTDSGLHATALVIDSDGRLAGFQDKVQLDPSEDGLYVPGTERRIFRTGPLVFGVVICHEGWRYPETVRWAARRGAQVVFHPHFHDSEPGAETFHEKAVLCRAAENTCYFATVNCAAPGSPTTSAVARPDGTLLAWHPRGEHGLLVADIDLDEATGLLASRYKPPLSQA